MTTRDVVVVGGGPAGLASAIVCAAAGLTTTLVERCRLPVDKPCGEGLLPSGVAALLRLGIDAARLEDCAHRIAGIRYWTPAGRSAEATFAEEDGRGIRRVDLSRLLSERARALRGLEIVTEASASVSFDATGQHAVLIGRDTVRARLVIGADGLHSRVRRSAGIAASGRRPRRWGARQHFAGTSWTDHVEVYFSPGFEVYVTPVRDGVNVACLWDADVVGVDAGASPVMSLAARVPDLARKLAGRLMDDRVRAAGPFNLYVEQPWREGVVLVGDAGGYLDAVTGEGVGLALAQAHLLSSTVIPALQHEERRVVEHGALRRFTQQARAASRSHHQLTRLLLRVARHPHLVERIVQVLAVQPALFAHLLDVNMGRRELWRVPIGSVLRALGSTLRAHGTNARG